MAENAKSILLLDDDHFLLDLYSVKFTQDGFLVHACSSVEDAVKTLKEGFKADAVVFDLVMPGQDGFAFLAALQAENLAPNAVRIALTNQSNDDEKKRAKDLGVNKYIIKASMIPSEVVAVVSAELDHPSPKEERD